MAEISKIQLPSGGVYDIKDATARQAIAGGVSFIIAWDGASTPVVSGIPAGVTVIYNETSYTGTLDADDATVGAFYLVKSSSQTTGGSLDYYDEYVPVGETGSKSWEKLGDTQIDLSDVVTGVTLNQQTTNFVTGYSSTSSDKVIGSDSTFSVTDPTISVTPTTTYVKASASGASTAWNSKDSVTAVTGLTNSNIKATASGGSVAWNSKDQVTAVTGVSASKTYVKASASGANTAWNSKDQVTAVTGVSATKKKLTTTTVTGVSGSTSASSVSTTSQTTIKPLVAATTTNYDSTNDILKGASVSGETLVLGAYVYNSGADSGSGTTLRSSSVQTTNSADTVSSVTVPIAASSATTVATGGLSETSVSTNVGGTIAIDASASGTDTVIGTDATFTITQPTISLATDETSATGRVQVAIDASASSTDTVIGTDSTFTVTQPTVALATGATAGTGVISVTTGSSGTDTVIGTDSTFTITQPTITLATDSSTATGRVQVATGITSATASGTAVAWNSKDEVTALTGLGTPSTSAGLNTSTSLTVTKGNQ